MEFVLILALPLLICWIIYKENRPYKNLYPKKLLVARCCCQFMILPCVLGLAIAGLSVFALDNPKPDDPLLLLFGCDVLLCLSGLAVYKGYNIGMKTWQDKQIESESVRPMFIGVAAGVIMLATAVYLIFFSGYLLR